MTTDPNTETCTAHIVNEHSGGTHHCVLNAGHRDPEFGTDHAGPVDDEGGRYRWSDHAIGAVPHHSPAASAGLGVSATPSHTDQAAANREAAARAIQANRFPDSSWESQPESVRNDYRSVADAVLAVLPPPADRAAVLAEVLPDWEAVYEPGNVSDYLIGYANDQDAATGMAEAWMRSQAEVTGRLEWVSEERMATGRYDRWFELIERHTDGIDTGPGIIVRRRLADEARQQPEPPVHGESVAHLAGLHDDEPAVEVLRIVSDWCVEANENGGVDAGDLAWRLKQAGYPLPDGA
jgi:hypothetical protein